MRPGFILETKSKSFSELFPNGTVYQVPVFQRDYSWTVDEWEDLWNDVSALDRVREGHFMGAIVIRGGDDSPEIVIDGQQRIATLSLLVLAVLSRIRELETRGIDPEDNRERFELLFGRFLGTKDAASLRSSPRLQLNRHDNGSYQDLLHFRIPLNLKKLRPSEKLLFEAFAYFQNRLRDFIPTDDGSQLASFLERIAKALVFMEIRVGDDQSAHTVFETLNARGLALAPTDLVKNYLFSLAASTSNDHDVDWAGEIWSRIAGSVRELDFPLFLRHYLASKKPYVRRDRLFRTIRAEVQKREQVFPFLEALDDAASVYQAIDNPHDDLWRDYQGAIEVLRVLKLFRVTQFRPLALAAWRRLKPVELVKVLKIVMVVSMRFNVIGRKGAHGLEQAYNQAAMAVDDGKCVSARQVKDYLRDVYISDKEFKDTFRYVTFEQRTQRKLATYILLQLEQQYTGKAVPDFETGGVTLEHILPENPGDGWEAFDDKARQKYTYYLGNLTLLDAKTNRLVGNQSPESKIAVYQSSQFALTRELDNPVWTPASIEQRQDQLAKLATAAWRL